MLRAARWSLCLACLSVSCAEAPGPPSLRLLEFRQLDVETVALNEELALFFSAPLDASSVTSDSVRVLDEEGLEARGERRVRGNAVTFVPGLPCSPDLSDGGFRMGRRYRLVLGGFPRPDGIRSAQGALLSQGLVLSFSTAKPGGTAPLFLDPFLGPFRLQPRGKPGHAIELPNGQLVLEYGEALDPSYVPLCRFQLSRTAPGAPDLETRVELIENRRDCAALRISLVDPDGTSGGRLPGGTYYLTMPGPELKTLGRRRVEPGWSHLVLSVPPERLPVGLAGTQDLADERPAGCDGTASWDEARGALRLRFPAAAGDGREGPAGARELRGARDLHATRIEIEAGRVVDLSELVGPVVLRSQTSFHLRGQLLRRGGAGKWKDPLTGELEGMAQREPDLWGPLSPWIERLIAPDQPWSKEPWTVLVAGGDLWVPKGGALEVEGHLVLVAGGEIRVEGRALARANLWSSGEGGNFAAHGRNETLPLFLDEPRTNPLRTPLVFGALTRSLPWSSASAERRTWLLGHEGIGRLSATLVEDAPLRGAAPRAAPGGSGRLLIRLEVDPGEGEAWDAPRLERVEVEGLALAPSARPEHP